MVPVPSLDFQSELPLYQQLYAYFRGLIQSQRLARGERLPATRELAGLLGLNRTTVSAAYELLEAEGLIAGQVGRGSFVTGLEGEADAGLDWQRLLVRRVPGTPAFPALNTETISFANSRPDEELSLSKKSDRFVRRFSRNPTRPASYSLERRTAIRRYATTGRSIPARSDASKVERSHDHQRVPAGPRPAPACAGSAGRPGGVGGSGVPGLKNLFQDAGAELLGIPAGSDGLDVELLGRALERGRPKLLVVTPNFQNPTGATMPLPARREVLRLARAAGTVVIENDIYGELRYEGDPVPAMKQLDGSGDVVLLRSFSKVAFPGLRVGWAIGPRPLIARMVEAKLLADIHTDQLSQAVLLRFAESGRLEAHLRRILEAGRSD